MKHKIHCRTSNQTPSAALCGRSGMTTKKPVEVTCKDCLRRLQKRTHHAFVCVHNMFLAK